MPNETGGVGVAIIYTASAVMTLHLFGWLLLGVPSTGAWLWPCLWLIGIVVAIFER